MVFGKVFQKIFGNRERFDITEIERDAKIHEILRQRTPVNRRSFRYWFERGCHLSEKIIKISPAGNTKESLKEAILTTDLDVTPTQVLSFTILLTTVLFISIIPFMFLPTALKIFLSFFPLIIGYLVFTYPSYLATVTKIRAADETVKVILYIVIYLRFNPQLEGAISFAAKHCSGPIGDDLKEILWGLEGGVYRSVREAISVKMEKWLVWDKEYVESLNLLESLTRMGSEERRKATLDKTLSYILESTYEKMKNYSRELKTPMTLIHMLGVTLPLLGLVMLPMISIFLHDQVNPAYFAFGYIVVLPLILFWYLKRSISKRPGAFAFPDISHHPDLPPLGKYVLVFDNKKYFLPVLMTAIIVGFFISIPGLTHFGNIITTYLTLKENPVTFEGEWKQYLSAMYDPDVLFTLTVYGLTVIWGIGAGLAIFFLGMSYQRLKIRNEIKMIEDEFQVALFKLSDILSSGIPIESALEEAAEKYRQSKLENSPMYSFFLVLIRNMRRLGMTLERAIFDKDYGVILRYPSVLVKDIMRIIVSSSQKSSLILSMATKTISAFLQRTKNVEALLRDLLEDISSSIKLQANFIAPVICAIVATMATFIIELLQMISEFLADVEQTFNLGGTFVHSSTLQFGDMLGLVRIEEVMPPTIFQLIVGIYMIEVVIILSYFLNGIRNGFDVTSRNVLIGKGLLTSLAFYSILLIISLFLTRTLFPVFEATATL